VKIERVGFGIVAAVALCGAALAQSAPEAPVRLGLQDLAGVRWSEVEADTLWAGGTCYKCAFSREGATYVPFLGSAAPENHPLGFRLAHVAVGGVAVPFEAFVPPARDGERIEYDRGGLVEVYDLGPDSVEQSFVLERLPAAGELVLRIAVEGDLAPGEQPEGLEFRSELGAVRYGRATVVDAAGRRASAPTTLAPGGIEIRVPAEFLARAAFPVTVDPLVTTFSVDATAWDTLESDVAYDATTNRMVVVYERVFSAADHDVVASVRDDAGALVPGGELMVDFTSEDWRLPHVANLRAAAEFLVVAQAGAAGSREIRGRLIPAQSPVLGPVFVISNLGGDKTHPSVGGDPSPVGPSYFCVAWERTVSPTDHDVHARLVDGAGSVYGATPILVDDSFATLDQYPSISKSDGMPPAASQVWTIVWQRNYGPGDDDIMARQLTRDGAPVNPTFTVEGSVANTTAPTVSSVLDVGTNARRYLVAWQRSLGGANYGIGFALNEGTGQWSSADLSTLQGEPVPYSKSRPSVDSDGQRFALAYDVTQPNGNVDVHLVDVYASGSGLGLGPIAQWLATSADLETRPRIAAEHGSGGTGHRYFVAWDRFDGADHDIEGARYTGLVGGPYMATCYGDTGCPCMNDGWGIGGCANSADVVGAILFASGTTSVAADTFVLEGSHMLANSTCIYLQGTTKLQPAAFGDGLRCVGGTLIRLKTVHNVNGASSYPVPGDPSISVRGLLPAVGGTRTYQAWYRDPVSYCTPTTFNITNAIEAVWTP